MYQWYVSTYVVSYVKLVANSSTTKPQCTGPVHAIFTMMRTAKFDEQSRRLELVSTDGRQAVSEPLEEIKASDLN
jgi:hypothetical protein